MIRVTVPRQAAEALMPLGCERCGGSGRVLLRYGVSIARHEVKPPVRGRCGRCDGSGSLPPALRLLVVDAEPECSLGYECDDTTHDGRCGEPRPDPAIIRAIEAVRAIEAGERIGIDVECERCDGSGTVRGSYPDYEALDCPHDCTDGRVSVGSVRPVRVLPVASNSNDWEYGHIDHIDVMGSSAYRRTPTEGFAEDVTDLTDALAVYGPAGSLVGKFAVEVEDARREP